MTNAAWPVKVELVKMRTILELIGGRRCSSEPPKILSTVLSSMLEAGLDVQRDDLAVEWISMWPNWMMNWVAHVCAAESRLCWLIPMVTRFTIRAIYLFFWRKVTGCNRETRVFIFSSLSWEVFFIWRKCILKISEIVKNCYLRIVYVEILSTPKICCYWKASEDPIAKPKIIIEKNPI